MANMTSGDCACPSRYYRYKRTKTAKNKLSKTSNNKVIGQKTPQKPQYLLFTLIYLVWLSCIWAKFYNFAVALIIQHSFEQQVDRLSNCSINILRMPYDTRIWSSRLFITIWVVAHGVYKTIVLQIDHNISRTLGLWQIWHHQRIVHAQVGTIGIKGPRLQKTNSVRLKITKL